MVAFLTAFLRDDSGSTSVAVGLLAAVGVPSLLLAMTRLNSLFQSPLASLALGLR